MTSDNQNDSWSACLPGTLNALATQVRQCERRRRLRKRALGASSAVIGCAAILFLLFNPPLPSDPNQDSGSVIPSRVNLSAHLSCREVLDSLDPYLLGELTGDSRQQIRSHLGHCENCQIAYRSRAQELKVEFSVLVPAPTRQSFALYAAR